MPTVAEVMDKVARECRASVPTDWVAATLPTYMELKDLLSETADDLLERVDWPDPISKDTTITGDGSETYSLPSDFKRLTRDDLAVYETTTTRRAGIPVATRGAWTHLEEMGSAGASRFYRLSGDEENGHEISFFQDLATGDEVIVSYVSRNWLTIAGTGGYAWTDTSAILLFPRRLIEMGVSWRFRQRKGLPYIAKMNEYEGALARAANDRRGVKKVCFGDGGEDYKPMRVPVPDFIPSS